MKIDLMNVLYTTSMVLLAFAAAIVITKTISKYTQKENAEEEKADNEKTKNENTENENTEKE